MSITSRPIKSLKKAPGPGKKPKIFSESLGISHLISLVENISTQKDSSDDLKIQKSKEWERKRKEAIKLKNLEKKGKEGGNGKEKEKKRRKGSKPEEIQFGKDGRPISGSNSGGSSNGNGKQEKIENGDGDVKLDTGSVHSVKIGTKATSKADIKSKLKAQMRQKSKERKERRKENLKSKQGLSTLEEDSNSNSISEIVSRLKRKGKKKEEEETHSTLGKEVFGEERKMKIGGKRKRSDQDQDLKTRNSEDKSKENQFQSQKEPISVLKSSTGKKSKRESLEGEVVEKPKGSIKKKKKVSFA